jgi:hypothetical protein
VGAAIIVTPFVYYAWFVAHHLIPLIFPDAFAYLWEPPLNLYFLTGRSLTQRLLFSATGSVPAVIEFLQLAGFLATALWLYFLFSLRRNAYTTLAIAVAISFAFSSYTLNLAAVIIGPEPLFVCLLLAFPPTLFLSRGWWAPWATLLVGVAFLFSKSVAPFMVVVFLGLHVLLGRSVLRERRAQAVFCLLLTLSAVSVLVTNRFDTALHVNLVNNAYGRLFASDETVAYLSAKYHMPTGPFVADCRGQWVLVPCLGTQILAVDEETRNYVIRDDAHGFAAWVRAHGKSAYLDYLFLYDPSKTVREFRHAFHVGARPEVVRFMTEYLGTPIETNEPNNLKTISATGAGRNVGFLGFDSLALVFRALSSLGYSYAEVVLVYIFLGWAIHWRVGGNRLMALAIALQSSALALFFLSFFGDAMEVRRHTFPAIIILTLGGAMMPFALSDLAVQSLRQRRVLAELGQSGERPE